MYLQYKQRNFKTWLQEIGSLTGSKANNNLLFFPETIGRGYCFADIIDRTFSFGILDAELNTDFTLHRLSNNQAGLLIFFNQTQVKNFIHVKSKKNSFRNEETIQKNNIFLSPTNTELQVNYAAGSRIKRLGIYLTPQWISVHLNDEVKKNIHQLTNQGVQLIDKMIIDEEINNTLQKIFTADFNCQKQRFQVKTTIVTLLDYFFKTYLNGQTTIRTNTIIPQEDLTKLKAIEELLKEDLDRFPSINKLAVIAQMCGTKLKQRFKQVYGYALYEYYNKNRLEKAKDFLATGISPKEAGLRIGFSDVSNFTKAFKKEYGITPGLLYERSQQHHQ